MTETSDVTIRATRYLMLTASVATGAFEVLDVIFQTEQQPLLTVGRVILFVTFGAAAMSLPRWSPRWRPVTEALVAAAYVTGVAAICAGTGGMQSPAFAFLWSAPLLIGLMFGTNPWSVVSSGVFALAAGTALLQIAQVPGPIAAYWLLVTSVVAIFASLATSMQRRARAHEIARVREATRRQQEHEQALNAQLAAADRMSALGTLAAGIAHDINNPLAFVLSNLRHATSSLRDSTANADVIRGLEDALDGAERVRGIVQNLKAFSRVEDTPMQQTDLRHVVESAITLAWNEIRHRARLVRDLRDVPYTLGSESRLGQVVLNLLINAAQAIPPGACDQNEIAVRLYTDEQGRAVLEVQDSGVGIPAAAKQKIFEPFFTTKPRGVGTGLGLSICHRIVTEHGGEIVALDGAARGTVMRVSLPPTARAELPVVATKPVTPPPPAAPQTQRPRVVVVDDDPKIGAVLQRLLKRDHDVRVFERGDEALEWLRAHDEWDVLVTDLMMPTVTGIDIYRAIEQRTPDRARRVLFMTGGAFTQEAHDFLTAKREQTLDKTCSSDELRRAIAAAMSATSKAIKVLIVDDEPQVLAALRRVCRRAGFDVEIASSGQEALERLNAFAADVLITDYRMSPMSGDQLLREVATRHPSVRRFMISAHTDRSASGSEGLEHRFIPKPWNDGMLVDAIKKTTAEAAP